MKLRYIIFLFLMGLFFKLSAQQHEIGGSIGVGKAKLIDDAGYNSLYDDINNSNFINTGFSYVYTPKGAFFNLNAGLNYSYKTYDNLTIDYATLPLHIDFFIGKHIQPTIGGGVYLATVLKKNDNYNKDRNYSLFRFGGLLKIGFNVFVFDKFKIALNYNINKDITPVFREQNVGKFQNQTSILKGTDNFLSFSVYYYLYK